MENFYTIDIEDVLKAYALEAQILYIIHNKSFLLYRRKGHYFTIPVIIMSTVSGVMSFNASVTDTTIGQYTIGGINITAGIITTIYKFLDYSSYENQHKILSVEYLHLFEDIRAVLSKNPKDRPNAIAYIERVESKRQELFDNFSIITDDVRKEFKAKYNNMKDLPLKLNHLAPIKIYGRHEDEHNTATKTIEETAVDYTV